MDLLTDLLYYMDMYVGLFVASVLSITVQTNVPFSNHWV